MEKGIRFFLALWAAKAAGTCMRLLGRHATHLPGVIALKICPDFLARVPKPRQIIGVTGTNGKTTVCNLLDDILPDCGVFPLNNRYGGNVQAGIVACLIGGCTASGRMKAQTAVIEIDERSAKLIFPYLQPDVLVVTNLFRDSMKRNAHAEFIFDLLSANIPKKTRLLVNADDLISSRLAPENERVTFGIARLEEDWSAPQNIVCDITCCPKCGEKLCFDYVRYNHIGRAHCPKCGFASLTPSYEMTGISRDEGVFTLRTPQGEERYPLLGDNVTDWYNTLAAVVALRELGIAPQRIADSMRHHHILSTRFDKREAGGKTVILQLSKGQNPVGTSRALDFVRQYPGRKAVVLLIEDVLAIGHSSENTAWLYDADFEFLAGSGVRQVVISGVRALDIKVRLLLAGVPEETVTLTESETAAADSVDLSAVDTIFVLYHAYTLKLADTVRDRLLARLGGEKRDAE